MTIRKFSKMRRETGALAFDFGYDNFGVKYHNNLETELKRAYGHEASDSVSGFIMSLRRAFSVFTGGPIEPDEGPAKVYGAVA